MRTEARTEDFRRFLGAFDCRHTLAVETGLRRLQAPTLIVWGDDDVYFDVRWAAWLAETIPGAEPPVVLPGARIFFPEERADEFNRHLRAFWHGK
jgi:pimeloyl-ACP methyl ester carboxylesterase